MKGEEIADLFGSNKEIHTESEWTRADFECESSKAWPNILATKLQKGKKKWKTAYKTGNTYEIERKR